MADVLAESDSVLSRLTSRVVVNDDGCWVWQGATLAIGYGRMTVGSRTDGTRRTTYTHRLAYELLVGPIPEGLVLDHLCRNRGCCNPDHLEPVTKGENSLRGFGALAVNARKTKCKHGHELSGENVYMSPGRPGQRGCRACRNGWRSRRPQGGK